MKRQQVSWPVLFVAAVVCVLVGAGATYLWLPANTATGGSAGTASAASVPSGVAPLAAATDGPLPDIPITLSPEAVAKAGLMTVPVETATANAPLRIAAIVEPNSYHQVTVAPLAPGRIVRVLVELGDRVSINAPIAEVYSPELAEAQTRYLSMLAEFLAVEQEIARTERLSELGAASKQELERVHAEHVGHRTEVASARSRLELLGMSDQQVDQLTASGQVAATMTVRSPIAGVITNRTANAGSPVDAATSLVTVVDLSTVWVVGALYERDFASAPVGTPVVVTTVAFPDLRIPGRVSYIDPQVSGETRTARVRVEVPNPRRQLRLGMFADIQLQTGAAATQLMVPRSAVQNVGDRTVVYIKDPQQEGRFVEREVRTGPIAGAGVVILSGLAAGDAVVSTGSFYLRAEGDRLGLRGAR